MLSEPTIDGGATQHSKAVRSPGIVSGATPFFSSMAGRLFALMLVVLLPLISYSVWEISHRMDSRRE